MIDSDSEELVLDLEQEDPASLSLESSSDSVRMAGFCKLHSLQSSSRQLQTSLICSENFFGESSWKQNSNHGQVAVNPAHLCSVTRMQHTAALQGERRWLSCTFAGSKASSRLRAHDPLTCHVLDRKCPCLGLAHVFFRDNQFFSAIQSLGRGPIAKEKSKISISMEGTLIT